ncbi:MAG: DNA mismatch repair protein MutS, partial [Proteobacteria bacterium]
DKYQTQTYPRFTDDTRLSCTRMFHPLIDRTKVVPNDFSFPEGKSLGLLTGSNMSGKSTFLRTLGTNQILANMGAPVFADSLTTRPLKIETCIEVTDSLRDGYSYFYAEVRRLRDILKMAATKTPVLFLIDEIFRGTNNRERQIGSRAVIQTLARQNTALGFISTHDLELTTLEQKQPSLLNLHFREDIDSEGKMIFSYQLKPGPCPTTNALKIMQSEGIHIDESEMV